MALTYQLIVLLGLSSGLWMGANAYDAECTADCCKVCPDDWFGINSRCFKFVNDPKDWSDAESACLTSHGNLASARVDELPYYRALVKRFSGGTTRTWFGGYEMKEGTWLNSDGSGFDGSVWGPGEPNNHSGTNENCQEMMGTAAQPFNDAPCTVKKAFMCVRDRVIKPTP